MRFFGIVNRLNRQADLNNYGVKVVALENAVAFTTLDGGTLQTVTFKSAGVMDFFKQVERAFDVHTSTRTVAETAFRISKRIWNINTVELKLETGKLRTGDAVVNAVAERQNVCMRLANEMISEGQVDGGLALLDNARRWNNVLLSLTK